MAKRLKSRIDDTESRKSRQSDRLPSLYTALRDARLNSRLSQQELAQKLGLRQRQISDLERAAMDPRLATIQNVARALDLELMLIPRPLIAVVEGIQRAGTNSLKEPMYTLQDDEVELDLRDPPEAEVGSSERRTRPVVSPGPSSKGPR